MGHPPGTSVGGDGHGGLYATSGAGGPGSAYGSQPPGSSDPQQDPDDTRRNKGWRGCLQIVGAFAALLAGYLLLITVIDALGLSAR